MSRVKRKSAFDHAQHAHIRVIMRMRSLIRAFTLHWYILQYLMIMLADSEGPDQPARMRRLNWAFAVRICQKTFSHGAAQNNQILKVLFSRGLSVFQFSALQFRILFLKCTVVDRNK